MLISLMLFISSTSTASSLVELSLVFLTYYSDWMSFETCWLTLIGEISTPSISSESDLILIRNSLVSTWRRMLDVLSNLGSFSLLIIIKNRKKWYQTTNISVINNLWPIFNNCWKYLNKKINWTIYYLYIESNCFYF